MKTLIIAFAILFILFLPLPFKITVDYKDKLLSVYFYNINLKKLLDRIKCKLKKRQEEFEEKINKEEKYILKSFKQSKVFNILNKLIANRFKPKLKIKGHFCYGFNDAFATAVSYGVSYNVSNFMYLILSKFFNIKRYSLEIIPDFNNLLVNFRITSIISVNLVKIIYILILIFFK